MSDRRPPPGKTLEFDFEALPMPKAPEPPAPKPAKPEPTVLTVAALARLVQRSLERYGLTVR